MMLSPFSRIESTPRVLIAIILTFPPVFLYIAAARFSGHAAISASPLIIRGAISVAAVAIEILYCAFLSLMSLAMPMPVGPLRTVIFIGVVSAGTVSSVVVALSSVFPVHAAKLKIIARHSSRERIFVNFFIVHCSFEFIYI